MPPALPVVVWTFGSAWAGGGKQAQAGNASWLAQHGYAVAVIDHRGSGVAQWPAQAFDVKAAVRWLRHNAGRLPGNVDRIVSNGTSAGGALSALLGASGNHPDYEAELRALGADLGFVALSTVLAPALKTKGRWLEVPAELHAPLAHAAILTTRGASNTAAKNFAAFLRSPEAQAVLAKFGYAPPPQ